VSRTRPELRRRDPQVSTWLTAAGLSDAGRQRQVNEDRFHIDLARGIFIVIDGVGGHAAGGKAADVALALLRERLERETGPVADRIREAITVANNEIYRLAATRAEWDGMACVLTVVVIDDHTATVGHVGDTRLYEIDGRALHKVTRDHSPVGEREDARELSEAEAMRHPRRNEVYRDVGSDEHAPSDPEFVDISEITLAADAALLLCSDGLTDLIDAASIDSAVRRHAGNPESVVSALVEAANAAGGKDNVTVVYIEGEGFAAASRRWPEVVPAALTGDVDDRPAAAADRPSATGRKHTARLWLGRLGMLAIASLFALAGFTVGRWPDRVERWFDFLPALQSASIIPKPPASETLVVDPAGSIAAALKQAVPGAQIVVEPGEYREQLTLKDGVRLVSRVPRGASIRLPADATDGSAVIAAGVSNAGLAGFRIVGDAATPLGVGISVDDSLLSIVDVEITGATRAGIEFSGARPATLLASDIHDNPGAALIINRAAAPRISHNTFGRNGFSERASGPLAIDAGAAPIVRQNVFIGLGADAFAALEQATGLALSTENWFVAPATARPGRIGPRSGAPPPPRTPPTPR
jgi:PPM family protein phosphatase